jgi:hypothetical protein
MLLCRKPLRSTVNGSPFAEKKAYEPGLGSGKRRKSREGERERKRGREDANSRCSFSLVL